MTKNIFGIVKIVFLKMYYQKKLHMNLRHRISLTTLIKIENSGLISINCGLHTKRNVTLHSWGGSLKIGSNVFFNENCIVVCHKNIEIGDNSTFGPNVCIYDHDHDHKAKSGFISDDIVIGTDVWVGANTVILRGTIIGNGCVVAAGSVLKGRIPANSVVYQRKEVTLKSFDSKGSCDV